MAACAPLAAFDAGGTRMAKAKPANSSPSANFPGLGGSRRRRPRASQSHANIGDRATTKIGCTDWNQLAGKRRLKGRWRSVLRSAKRLSVEPACSKEAQKRAEATNRTMIAAERFRSSGDQPAPSNSQEKTATAMASSTQPT